MKYAKQDQTQINRDMNLLHRNETILFNSYWTDHQVDNEPIYT